MSQRDSATSGSHTVPVKKMALNGMVAEDDCVAIEEPLAIRLAWPTDAGLARHDIAVTMRTPVNDFDLAAGFLFTEGFIQSIEQVADIAWLVTDDDRAKTSGEGRSNTIMVRLHEAPAVDMDRLRRNFFVSSSCGVCGKASIDAISAQAAYPVRGELLELNAQMLHAIPGQLISRQKIFAGTGSIHAAANFSATGLQGEVYEDVGRHNAVDKLIGAKLRGGALPLWNSGIVVSGRASFELVQKARMAGCPVLVAVGAPSSLAIELAWEADMSLIGFLRDGRFNVYAGPARIKESG